MRQCNGVFTLHIVLGKNILHIIQLNILPRTLLFLS